MHEEYSFFDDNTRRARYEDREAVRREIGARVIRQFNDAESIINPRKRDERIAEIREDAQKEHDASELLLDILHEAALQKGRRQKTEVVEMGVYDLKDLADFLRIHPDYQDDWAGEIAVGTMRLKGAFNFGYPAGRVNLIVNVPQTKEIGPAVGMQALWVNEHKRLRKVASRLIEVVEHDVLSSPDLPNTIVLAVEPDNEEAHPLYAEKHGYEPVEVENWERFESVDATESTLIMVKELK